MITPGENDRGARRIVAGEEGELYYTDDHYDSFQRILVMLKPSFSSMRRTKGSFSGMAGKFSNSGGQGE